MSLKFYTYNSGSVGGLRVEMSLQVSRLLDFHTEISNDITVMRQSWWPCRPRSRIVNCPIAGIAGSNPAEDMGIRLCLQCVAYVVASVTNYSSVREVLPGVCVCLYVCVCVCFCVCI